VFFLTSPTLFSMSPLRFSRLLLTFLLISGACASAYELSPTHDDGLANPSPSLPGQIVTSSLPGQIVTSSLPGQIVGSLPGQIVQSLPGQVVRPLSGQIVRSLSGQVVRPLSGEIKRPVLPWAMNLAKPILTPDLQTKTRTFIR
jgi:hypothetical protein